MNARELTLKDNAIEDCYEEDRPSKAIPDGNFVVVYWNGQGGLLAGPYWEFKFETMDDAREYARELQECSSDGWHCIVEAMSVKEYRELARRKRR